MVNRFIRRSTSESAPREKTAWRKVCGGETLRVLPCPNADDAWADAVVTIAHDAVGGLREAPA